MGGELLLVVLELDDERLAGVGAEAELNLLDLLGGPVLDLGRGEVEVAGPEGAHHEHVGVVGAGRESV